LTTGTPQYRKDKMLVQEEKKRAEREHLEGVGKVRSCLQSTDRHQAPESSQQGNRITRQPSSNQGIQRASSRQRHLAATAIRNCTDLWSSTAESDAVWASVLCEHINHVHATS
jgi:hypothetical protein